MCAYIELGGCWGSLGGVVVKRDTYMKKLIISSI